MGYGVYRARLGDEISLRISVTSILYFTTAAIESYLRLNQTKDNSSEIILAAIPLALIDSLICYWIFTSLIQTMRTLRLRRNVVKLQFYKHFKNVLLFGVLMSVIFMLYSIKMHRRIDCVWKDLWIDDAFWHVLFSILLTVVAILWCPTSDKNYTFTPLLDDDCDDDDETEVHFSSDNFGSNVAKIKNNRFAKPQDSDVDEDESDIRWVEENISASILVDSDEELMSTKFEVSKMQ